MTIEEFKQILKQNKTDNILQIGEIQASKVSSEIQGYQFSSRLKHNMEQLLIKHNKINNIP